MLSKSHIDNFTDQKVKIFIPEFAKDAPEYDKLWLTFMWMVGTTWGFDRPIWFYYADYATLGSFGAGVPFTKTLDAFNERFNEWIAIGKYSNMDVFAEFRRTDWPFVEYWIEDIRMQRIWIHLYNAVWGAAQRRYDLWEAPDWGYEYHPIHGDTGWFFSKDYFQQGIDRRVEGPEDYAPHYLKSAKLTYGNKSEFVGKIMELMYNK